MKLQYFLLSSHNLHKTGTKHQQYHQVPLKIPTRIPKFYFGLRDSEHVCTTIYYKITYSDNQVESSFQTIKNINEKFVFFFL